MARKVIVSKFQFFFFEVVRVCMFLSRFFAAKACVNLLFPLQKPNSDGTLQLSTRGFNAAFSLCCAVHGKNVQIERTQKDSLKAYLGYKFIPKPIFFCQPEWFEREKKDDSPCTWAQIGNCGPRKEPIRLQKSLPCPLRKKILKII